MYNPVELAIRTAALGAGIVGLVLIAIQIF